MGRDQEPILGDPFELALRDGIDEQYWVDHLTRSQRAVLGAREPGIEATSWGAQRPLPATAENGFTELLRVGPFPEPDDFLVDVEAVQAGNLSWSERPIIEIRASMGIGNTGWSESWDPPGAPSDLLVYPPRRVVTCQQMSLSCRQITPGTHDFGAGAVVVPGILRATLVRRRAGTLPQLIAYQLVACAAAASSTRIHPPPRGATYVTALMTDSGGAGTIRIGASAPGAALPRFIQQVASLNNLAVAPFLPVDGYGNAWWIVRSVFAGAETIMVQWLR